jgi:uncharacterized protein (TIGR03086 family)
MSSSLGRMHSKGHPMDLIAALDEVGTEFGRLVAGTAPEQLGATTPCTEFSVRDVINHVTGGATMFASAFENGAVPDEELGRIMAGDLLGDDPVAAYTAASERVQAAYHAPGALEGMVALPFGEMPREAAIGIAVFDVAVHAWDLAQATGQELQLSQDLAEEILALGRGMGIDQYRGMMFAEEVIIIETAPAWDRVAAYSGRQP